MQQYKAELNTVAIDVALEALHGATGRDEAKRVYELTNRTMETVFQAGAASRDADVAAARADAHEAFEIYRKQTEDTVRKAETVGYQKGRANAMFEMAAERLNAEATAISPALAPQVAAEAPEETALINAASALG